MIISFHSFSTLFSETWNGHWILYCVITHDDLIDCCAFYLSKWKSKQVGKKVEKSPNLGLSFQSETMAHDIDNVVVNVWFSNNMHSFIYGLKMELWKGLSKSNSKTLKV